MLFAAALLAAVPPGPPPKHHVLIATWFNGSAPAQTTQTTFGSRQSCERARAAVLADARRVEEGIEAKRRADESRGFYGNPIIPRVSAVCVAR